jgi:hypothetical protein
VAKRKLKPVTIRSMDDVDGCILRFSVAWQEQIPTVDIKPTANDLLAASEWMRNRIAVLEHGLREASERFHWLASHHLHSEFARAAARQLAENYWELQAPPKRRRRLASEQRAPAQERS